MDRIYQILVVSRGAGINFIIPDVYAYTTKEQALVDVQKRKEAFEAAGEKFEYKGEISNLDHIRKIYTTRDEDFSSDAYIYSVRVKEEYDGKGQ